MAYYYYTEKESFEKRELLDDVKRFKKEARRCRNNAIRSSIITILLFPGVLYIGHMFFASLMQSMDIVDISILVNALLFAGILTLEIFQFLEIREDVRKWRLFICFSREAEQRLKNLDKNLNKPKKKIR